MGTEERLDRIEQFVPEECIRHHEQIKAMFACVQEIKDSVKWGVRLVIGAVFVALTSTFVGIMVTRTLAQGR